MQGTDTDAPANSPPLPRRRGGQELPDEVQDRPEQNAGYDAAVRQGAPANPDVPVGFDDIEDSPESRLVRKKDLD